MEKSSGLTYFLGMEVLPASSRLYLLTFILNKQHFFLSESIAKQHFQLKAQSKLRVTIQIDRGL